MVERDVAQPGGIDVCLGEVGLAGREVLDRCLGEVAVAKLTVCDADAGKTGLEKAQTRGRAGPEVAAIEPGAAHVAPGEAAAREQHVGERAVGEVHAVKLAAAEDHVLKDGPVGHDVGKLQTGERRVAHVGVVSGHALDQLAFGHVLAEVVAHLRKPLRHPRPCHQRTCAILVPPTVRLSHNSIRLAPAATAASASSMFSAQNSRVSMLHPSCLLTCPVCHGRQSELIRARLITRRQVRGKYEASRIESYRRTYPQVDASSKNRGPFQDPDL